MLKGYGTREKGIISSLHLSWIFPVVDNVKVPLSTWCTCIIQIMHFFCGSCYKEESGIGKTCYVNIMWRNYQYVHNDNIRQ